MDQQGKHGNSLPREQVLLNLRPEEYQYELPPARIAKYPPEVRDSSKLLVYRRGMIGDASFRDIVGELPPDSLLVRNETRVIQARLFFQRLSGARIEIFLLDPDDPSDYQLSFASTRTCVWKCLVGNAKKWKEKILERRIFFSQGECLLQAEKLEAGQGEFLVRFHWTGSQSFGEILEQAGIIPIPPYLERESEEIDRERYQTLYSHVPGSVAAPTAGLHFSTSILDQLRETGIKVCGCTLHVGAGTFKPIQGENIASHQMHTEYFSASRPMLEELYAHRGPVIAVGTTSVRTLESLYWIGNRLHHSWDESPREVLLGQWDAYRNEQPCSKEEAFEALFRHMDRHRTGEITGTTQIMIVPGYRFRMIRGLVTNFHMPGSSLILLVAAFIGEDWKKVYAHALESGYRFLSYGDSSLLLP